MPVVGFLDLRSPEAMTGRLRGFRQGLGETGYVEGDNVGSPTAGEKTKSIACPELAADLVRRKVAVMFATGNTAVALTAKAATATIPILFISGEDPVRLGLVTIQEESVANSTSSIRNTNPQRR
jgi:putative ABC transport system substrate-binding protein